MNFDETAIKNMTDEEVIHYAELNDDPWVQRLLEVITNLEIEVSYNKQTLNDINQEEYPE